MRGCQVKLNIGGTTFVTSYATLTSDRNCMFASMLSGRYSMDKDENDAFFIDR